MAERFKEGVKKVRAMNSVVNKMASKPEPPSMHRRRSVIDSFKSAVGKVKTRAIVASFLSDRKSKKPASFQPTFTTKKIKLADDAEEESEEDEKVEENIWERVSGMTEEEVVEFTSKELAGRFLKSKPFRTAILMAIISNSILIAIETDKNLERKYSHVFMVLDQSLMTIFVCEILLKWYHDFLGFWRTSWNILDFFIVLALLFGPHLTSGSSGSRGVIRILRVLRAFRSLRSISSQPGLQVVVQTILQSVPDMANIVLLLVIIMLVFSVIGITLFRDIVPKYFGSLSAAMFSLFICLTQDGWMEIFRAFQEHGDTYYMGGGLYLLVFIAIGAFIFTNLVVAVVVTNLEVAVVDVKEEEERYAREMALQGKNIKNDDENELEIIKDDDITTNVFYKQNPMNIPSFQNITIERLEDYCLIVSCMEDNLVEYKRLMKDINKIFSDVVELNENAQMQGLFSTEQNSSNDRRRSSTSSVRRAAAANRNSGDIMSDLMGMEGSHLIDSRNLSLSAILQQGAEKYTQQHRGSRSSEQAPMFDNQRRRGSSLH